MNKKIGIVGLIVFIVGLGVWCSNAPEKINKLIVNHAIQKELPIGVPFEEVKKKYNLKLVSAFENPNAWKPKKGIPKKASYFLNEIDIYTAKIEIWVTTGNANLIRKFVLIDSKLKSASIFYFGANNFKANIMKKNLYKWFGKPTIETVQFQIWEKKKSEVPVWIKFGKTDSKQRKDVEFPDDSTSFDSYELQLEF